ncbi:unnamed protein product, partial [Brassica rapa]
QVGTNGDEGYCVNVPWSCGGVGDNVYIYAFQQVVIPIVGFDAARGDPLECCDVITPAGYSRMTQMLGDLCGGKMLVILEGGYNELPIATTPSRAGLQTVIDIMNIQMKFCPLLATAYSKLLSEKSGEKEACSGPYMVEMESKEALYNISRFCSVFLLRADIIVFYTNGVTCELKSLLEPRHKNKKEASYSAATHQKELMEQAIWYWKSVAMCTISFKKKNAFPQSLSLVPTKYTLWNLFHHALSNTEDIQSSAVDLLTYTSQASLFEIYTRFTVLNDVDETGNEPMISLSLTKGGEQG